MLLINPYIPACLFMKLFFQNHELTKLSQDGKDGCKAKDPSRQGSAGLQTSTTHTEGLRNPQPDEKVSICAICIQGSAGIYDKLGHPQYGKHRNPSKPQTVLPTRSLKPQGVETLGMYMCTCTLEFEFFARIKITPHYICVYMYMCVYHNNLGI